MEEDGGSASSVSLTQRLRQQYRQQRQAQLDDEISSVGMASHEGAPTPTGIRPRAMPGYDASIDVMQIVPHRPLPEWVLHRGKGGKGKKRLGRSASPKSQTRAPSPGRTRASVMGGSIHGDD
ncbi:unnamed protein product, partial [Phaeothamnion confervicola]